MMDEIDDGLEVLEQEDADESNAKSRMSPGGQGKYNHKQAYRKAWENLPDFKGWLQEVPGEPTRAFCSYCNVSLFAHRLSLLKHTCTMKHQRATQKVWIINNKSNQNESVLHEIPSTSQPTLEPLPGELDLQTSKVNSSLASGMTVTILQDGEDGVLKLQIQDKITKPENNIMLVEDDLDLDDPPTVDLHLGEVTEQTNKSEIPSVQTRAPVTRASVMAHSPDFPLSTHVLDTSKGQPVTQLSVSLYRLIDGKWTLVNEGITSDDGRCNKLIKKSEFVAGRYKLHFDTDRYFALERKETLYPFVEIAFDVHAPHDHYHIPLLLSAYGYSTYRGS